VRTLSRNSSHSAHGAGAPIAIASSPIGAAGAPQQSGLRPSRSALSITSLERQGSGASSGGARARAAVAAAAAAAAAMDGGYGGTALGRQGSSPPAGSHPHGAGARAPEHGRLGVTSGHAAAGLASGLAAPGLSTGAPTLGSPASPTAARLLRSQSTGKMATLFTPPDTTVASAAAATTGASAADARASRASASAVPAPAAAPTVVISRHTTPSLQPSANATGAGTGTGTGTGAGASGGRPRNASQGGAGAPHQLSLPQVSSVGSISGGAAGTLSALAESTAHAYATLSAAAAANAMRQIALSRQQGQQQGQQQQGQGQQRQRPPAGPGGRPLAPPPSASLQQPQQPGYDYNFTLGSAGRGGSLQLPSGARPAGVPSPSASPLLSLFSPPPMPATLLPPGRGVPSRGASPAPGGAPSASPHAHGHILHGHSAHGGGGAFPPLMRARSPAPAPGGKSGHADRHLMRVTEDNEDGYDDGFSAPPRTSRAPSAHAHSRHHGSGTAQGRHGVPAPQTRARRDSADEPELELDDEVANGGADAVV
jgi:hypothetical protein